MQAALERVSPYVAELFEDDAVSVAAAEAGAGVLPSSLLAGRRPRTSQRVVDRGDPDPARRSRRGARAAAATASTPAPMGYLLAEMQHIARSHPGATW